MSSRESTKWPQLLVLAGSVAAIGAAAYFYLKDAGRCDDYDDNKKRSKKKNLNEITIDDVLNILTDISLSQDAMKQIMKEITKELKTKHYGFGETYERVKDVQPEDPLEKHGISMQEFDAVLELHQDHPGVRDSIARIMGAPDKMNISTESKSVNRETVVKVHTYMLEELRKLVEEFENLDKSNVKYDMKTVTIAAQAIVGAKVEEAFGLSSDDIECAVLLHHQSLAMDTEFARINMEMQNTMSSLMGGNFPSGGIF